MKTSIRSLAIIALTITGFAFSPKAQAVVPPPDGGYPGFNTAEGDNALKNLNTATGQGNTAVGWFSLLSDVDGGFNTAVGAGALVLNTGSSNTGVGAAALILNTAGERNTAVGTAAMVNNDVASDNTAVGDHALTSNVDGDDNTAFGSSALFSNTAGSKNTAVGFQALFNNVNQDNNTAVGFGALFSQTFGNGNTAIGRAALGQNISGANNTALGNLAGNNVTTADNVICIGSNVAGEDVSNTCYIGNIFGVTSAGATAVVVNKAGKLGTIVSSRRFKDDIKPMDQASEALFALRPVSFHYKKEIDPESVPQFGLVAEDVEAVNPDLVVRDAEGKVNTVRYDQVNAMLLNEFLKEHKRVEELKSAMAEQRKDVEAAIVRQQKTTEALVARLNEQEAWIQKVSAQVEMRKSGSQMLVENQ